ncbi:hypothetical protein Pmani_032459 [Petrolisthes manimaculis]|uniref:RNA-directed DNA polymerase n=1 Tax=Petrolisthes manimaculis TaxID=1843537 RepID=A0AAE1NTL9_9EUCA|nr:hypothetical protein Pmani_032459 [Petrolisthes manimaculis]
MDCETLVDTGCTRCIAHVSLCSQWTRENVSVRTVSGEFYECMGTGVVQVQLPSGVSVSLNVIVVPSKPLNFDFILGMNGITALHGVRVCSPRDVRFGIEEVGLHASAVASSTMPEIDERDFRVIYDSYTKQWTVSWNWCDGKKPPTLFNTVAEYKVPEEVREEYENELTQWIMDGWLVPYNEDMHGPVRGTIPLMAVVQQNKQKVRPVLDFRELNSHLDLHTAEADVCSEKIREWRQRGQQVALIDLRKAYLQIHVHSSLWKYQTVVFHGRRYCLTRLGFGLNIAPLVLKKVLSRVLSCDEKVNSATSPYLDDILVDESKVTAAEVESHLRRFGLLCKPPESVQAGARVLGIRVWGERNRLVWRRDNEIGELPKELTRRIVFSICGRLTSHLPVCGWLRVAGSYIKRRTNAATASWDDKVTDLKLYSMITETLERVKMSDPARGRWDVAGEEATLWVDASSIAYGAVIEVDGGVIEDACWLRRNECSHINLAELAIKGLNLVISWKFKKLILKTDSLTVYHWLDDALSGRSRVKTKAASEMLIRRRLETFTAIVNEYSLCLEIQLVPSASNRADELTRVPKKWLSLANDNELCTVAATVSDQDIANIHATCGHPGVRRTMYFCRRLYPTVQRQHVRDVVRNCRQCQSIDPAPAKWQKGELGVSDIWGRVSMDTCHVGNRLYLTLIDCGPTRYAIWKRLRRQDSSIIIEQLEPVFFERGAPRELLTDNAASFRSSAFSDFARRWSMEVRYRCANVPSGNGISERNHRTVKTILARKGCSVMEAVYRYNTMPRGNHAQSAPANRLFQYEVRLLGIDDASQQDSPVYEQHRFSEGDRVWVRHPSRRCDSPSTEGTVTRVVSAQNVEVDGMPRHVRDLRLSTSLPRDCPTVEEQLDTDAQEDLQIRIRNQTNDLWEEEDEEEDEREDEEEEEMDSPGRRLPRRSSRERRPVRPFQYGDQ